MRFPGWRRAVPASLLLIVAASQIWLSRAHALAPWAGGGFGMFASTDVRGSRHLHAFGLYPGVRRELPIPVEARERAWRVLSFPSRDSMERLGQRLGEDRDPTWGEPEAVEIQVWATSFAPGTLTPSAHLLRALEVPLERD